MKDKLLQIRVDEDFLSKLEYLRKINGFKSIAETIRKIIEKERRKETDEERKKGEWIWDNNTAFERCRCSECGYYRQLKCPEPENYCPNCGAKMN